MNLIQVACLFDYSTTNLLSSIEKAHIFYFCSSSFSEFAFLNSLSK